GPRRRKKYLGPSNGAGGNNPKPGGGGGPGLLRGRGYGMVWSGWEDEGLAPPGNNRALARLPIARNADGSSVVEDTITEVIFDNPTGMNLTLTYRAANLDQSQARILAHNHTPFAAGPLVHRLA